MYLVVVQGHASGKESPGLISVWVKETTAAVAQQRALDTLRAEGFSIMSVETVTETGPEDYFRACESKAAFERAQHEGIAWRAQEIEG